MLTLLKRNKLKNTKTLDLTLIVFVLIIWVLYYNKIIEGGVKTSVNVQAWGLGLLITGVIVSIWKRKELKEFKARAIILTILLIVLGLNILLFDYLNIVVQYDDWIKRGMP